MALFTFVTKSSSGLGCGARTTVPGGSAVGGMAPGRKATGPAVFMAAVCGWRGGGRGGEASGGQGGLDKDEG
eukprot:CAMPEP_0175556276 /NCGR_PEP_ID=MMETSP0096-20121207/34785_1 /TAXON_ID=311494 /ORGANISM="Alexandrium monilatum, Strain CCMP3105" /LENGTH=71 /DNA_ID=CAMNT_0016859407 /DNA_START=270 /DNA_END=481 /DNA_ORIENTATION=-